MSCNCFLYSKKNYNRTFSVDIYRNEQFGPAFYLVFDNQQKYKNTSAIVFEVGKLLYWVFHCPEETNYSIEFKKWLDRSLQFYCNNIDLRQKSVFTFLWIWKKLGGVKDVGKIIAKIIWNVSSDSLESSDNSFLVPLALME